jgi:hypothetical protein
MIAPLAHAGHVLIDAAIFLVPVGAVGVMLLIANLRGRDREGKQS